MTSFPLQSCNRAGHWRERSALSEGAAPAPAVPPPKRAPLLATLQGAPPWDTPRTPSGLTDPYVLLKSIMTDASASCSAERRPRSCTHDAESWVGLEASTMNWGKGSGG